MSKLSSGEMRQVFKYLDALGMTHIASEARALHLKGAELGSRALAAPKDLNALRKRLARDLATGAIDIDNAVTEEAQAAADEARVTAAAALWRTAKGTADNMASTSLVKLGESIIEDPDLRAFTDKAIADATKAVAVLPEGVTDDATGVAAGPAVLKAWVIITDAHNVWTTATRLVRYLRQRDVLPRAQSAGTQDTDLYEMRHPENAPLRRAGARAPHPVWQFAENIRQGVEYTLRTAAQVDETAPITKGMQPIVQPAGRPAA